MSSGVRVRVRVRMVSAAPTVKPTVWYPPIVIYPPAAFILVLDLTVLLPAAFARVITHPRGHLLRLRFCRQPKHDNIKSQCRQLFVLLLKAESIAQSIPL